jgi:hypothetical protein
MGMIALNEAHSMPAVLDNVCGWTQELLLVDGYSTDRRAAGLEGGRATVAEHRPVPSVQI